MIFQRIVDLRKDHDLTQAFVASQLGLYTTTYARYERGECDFPFYLVIEIAKFYNVSLDYLAGFIDTPRTLDGSPYRISKNITINHSSNFKISN